LIYWNLALRTQTPVPSPRGKQQDLRQALGGKHLGVTEWMRMNAGIEADGSNLPVSLQKGIFQMLAQLRSPQLFPLIWPNDGDEAAREVGMLGAVLGIAKEGFAVIPQGGLERLDPLPPGGHTFPGQPQHGLGQVYAISETLNTGGSAFHPMGTNMFALAAAENSSARSSGRVHVGATSEQMIYLLLSKQPLFLFFATAPGDTAPYAFIRLQDVAVRDVDPGDRRLVLAGKRKAMEGEVCSIDSGEPVSAAPTRMPFGDPRMPLTLCFILADGRYQPFDALWLELQFSTDEELEAWQEHLTCADSFPNRKGSRERVPNEKTPPLAASLQRPVARRAGATGASIGRAVPEQVCESRTGQEAGPAQPRTPPLCDPGGLGQCQASAGHANVDYVPTTPVEGMSLPSATIGHGPHTPGISREPLENIEDVSPRRAG